MTRKIYRTAQGKTVDLGALMLQHENTRAVGNMNVNARGDLIDSWNRPIDRRTQQVQKQYDRQVTNVQDEPVHSMAKREKHKPKEKNPESVETASEPIKTDVKPEPPQGLAAAIARAKQFRQEPEPDPKQQPQGPKRI